MFYSIQQLRLATQHSKKPITGNNLQYAGSLSWIHINVVADTVNPIILHAHAEKDAKPHVEK